MTHMCYEQQSNQVANDIFKTEKMVILHHEHKLEKKEVCRTPGDGVGGVVFLFIMCVDLRAAVTVA